MRVLVGLLALLMLVFAGCTKQAAPCITVIAQTIICGSDTLVEDIQMPVLEGFSDPAFEKALNTRIRVFVDSARQDAREQARIVQQWMPYVCVLTVDYEVKNACGLFSMRITSDLENGGTGMPHTIYINADAWSNSTLTLDDLFRSADYRAGMDQYLSEMMAADAHFFPDTFFGVNESTTFFVSKGRLYIAFGKYEVASGMAGEPVFEMPPELISQYLKPKYAGHF